MIAAKKKLQGNSRSRSRPQDSGSVLILVVWVVVALSLLAVGFGARGAFALSLSTRLFEQEKARQAAQGAVPYVLSILKRDQTEVFDSLNEEWVNNAVIFKDIQIGESTITIKSSESALLQIGQAEKNGLVDEDRKINVNVASKTVLRNLIAVTTDLETPQINAIADAIVDWRDKDSNREIEGAEKFDYLNLEPPYESKDGPFESINELLLVKGVTQRVYDSISPYLTVYGSEKVNVNTASSVVFRAMGISDSGVSRIMGSRFGADGIAETSDDQFYASVNAAIAELGSLLPAEDLTQFVERQSEDLLGIRSEAFSFTVDSITQKQEGNIHVDCVILRTGKILSWFER